MNWYVAEAVFNSIIDGAEDSYTPLIERSWFLVSADDESLAQAKAVALAEKRLDAYDNPAGERVRWVFQRIERLREVMDRELQDGTEVWCEIEREGESQ